MASMRIKKCSACHTDVEYVFRQKPESCPVCGSVYWTLPKDERLLFELQDELFAVDSPSEEYRNAVISKMYKRLVVYARNIIKNEIKNKFTMPEDILNEKSIDLANKIAEKYLKDPEFEILHSFGGLMARIKRQVLYADAKEERHDSLNAHINSNDEYENDELEDNLSYVGFQPIFNSTTLNDSEPEIEDTNKAVSNVFLVILAAFKVIKRRTKNSSAPLFFLTGMYNKLVSKNEAFLSDFFDYAGSNIEGYIKKVELALYDQLMEGR